jgi:hypothetical protein
MKVYKKEPARFSDMHGSSGSKEPKKKAQRLYEEIGFCVNF